MKQILSLTILLLSNSSLFAQLPNEIIIGANNNQAIMSANLDGSMPTEINTGLSQSFYTGAYNATDGKIYMAWLFGVYSMNVDGSDFQTLYTSSGTLGNGIDIDEANGYVYFTHTDNDQIYRMNLDGSDLTSIYGGSGNIEYASALQLDIANGHIYFGEWLSSQTDGLFRVDLDGTNEITIISNTQVRQLKTDLTNGHHYYTEHPSGDVYRCNLDGSDNVPFLTGQVVAGLDINLNTNTIYYSSYNHFVITSDMTGANINTIINANDITFSGDPLEAPHGPVLVYNPGCSVDLTVSQNGAVLTSNDNGAAYQWLNCDKQYEIIPNETNQTFTPSITGNYAVQVTSGNCVDTSTCLLIDYAGIEELYLNEKELVKIIDLTGRETELKPNTPLILIYSDGTRKRVMDIEN